MTADFAERTRHLALSYLAIIMTLSSLFSGILYSVMSSQLGRPLPPHGQVSQSQLELADDFRERIAVRDRQTRASMISSLVILNAVMFGGGAWLSYYLARRTLRPIQRSMEVQGRFISDASHELRTPLTALQTTNEVALRKKHIDDEKARSVLSKNITEIGKLHHLTETLLTLSQTEYRQLTRESVWLDEVAREAVESLQSKADDKKITIDNRVQHVQISANRLAMTQVVIILIDNAVKYSPKGTTVTIGTTNSKAKIALFVKDEGVGIAPEDHERVFDRFYRADTARTRTDTSGYGLGLSIAQSLCQRQGYYITLRSDLGKGSEFTIKSRPLPRE